MAASLGRLIRAISSRWSAAHILETLAAVNGVRKAAAERLGMSERTLRYKLAQYRLEAAGGKPEAD